MSQFSRRTLLKTTALAAAAAGGRAFAASRKPNIIFILADDLGYGDLSCQGQTKFATPNIDRIASEGMRFTDHYAGCSVCAPSRCSLMTGKHTGHSIVRGNYEVGPRGFGAELELRPEDVTVAEVLKTQGYATGVIGKWGMGMDGTTGEPKKKGFDESLGFLNQAYAHYYYPEYLFKNGEKVPIPENQGGKRGRYVQDVFTGANLEFVEKHKDEPFFLYAAYTTPHAELLVPNDSLNEFKGKFEPETPYVKDGNGSGAGSDFGAYASQPTPRAAFAAMITRFDRDLGMLMAKLKELGIDQDTLVLFSSDNGPHQEGGADPDYFKSAGPFRGIKRDLYEGGIRVPLIARWPGKIAAGTIAKHPCALWDFLPTAAEIAGAEAPADIDGISYLPTLLGREQPEHEYLYWEFHERPTSEQAVRMGRWKGVRHAPEDPVEVYDLEADPGETRDLAAERPEIADRLRKVIDTTRTPSGIWPLKTKEK